MVPSFASQFRLFFFASSHLFVEHFVCVYVLVCEIRMWGCVCDRLFLYLLMYVILKCSTLTKKKMTWFFALLFLSLDNFFQLVHSQQTTGFIHLVFILIITWNRIDERTSKRVLIVCELNLNVKWTANERIYSRLWALLNNFPRTFSWNWN